MFNSKLIPRILFVIAGLLIFTLNFLPLWRITLLAPQYPDGVHLFIYINKIGGATPGTLQNVNILNHYIGMKPIDPDSIKELIYLPYIFNFFAIMALIIAWLNKKWAYITWFVVFSIILLLAFYDFYLWEYDYGHNLDPKAPMSFEGESFQPPLIGSKTIINFIAKSYPHIGGWMLILAVALAGIGTFFKIKDKNA
jgi:copper chaperone NosL